MTSTCSGCFPVYQYNQLAHTEEGGCLYCPFIDNESDNFDDIIIDLKNLFDEVSSDETSSNFEFPANVFEIDIMECCICFENINKQKNNCTTECGHSFCFKCIATSIVYNNHTCPYCRTALVDIPNKINVIEEDEDSDYDEGSYEEYQENRENQENEEDEEYIETSLCEIEEVVNRLQKNNFTMQDVVSMLLGRYNKNDQKYTDDFICELNNNFNQIIEDADNEKYEQELFAAEDKH